MNAQDLRNSILQLAIQGKLVEQRVEEGRAEELYQQIQDEKERFTKEGKVKKEKALERITENELPFKIPESWKWVRMGNISNFGRCNAIASKTISASAWVLDLEDIEKDTGKVLKRKTMAEVKSVSNKHVFKKGDVLFSKLRPYLNKVVIADEDGYCTSEILPVDFGQYVLNRFAQIVLMSPYFIAYAMKCSYGVKMPRLGKEDGQNALFPLPPLEEQRRIVAKIEELMPYVDIYGENQSELEVLNKKFPEEIQKSILQYAIQGKLVEQREEEGTAEELYQQIQEEKAKLIKEGQVKNQKALSEITEDEIPFEIPDSWKWVRIGDIFNLQAGKNVTSQSIYDIQSDEELYPCHGGNGLRGYVKIYNRDGVFALIGRQGALCGNINYAYGKFYATEHAVVVDHFNLTDAIWSGYFLKALNLNQYATATAQPGLAVKNIEQILIPLPPLSEQKRIVSKIDELMISCKQLVKLSKSSFNPFATIGSKSL